MSNWTSSAGLRPNASSNESSVCHACGCCCLHRLLVWPSARLVLLEKQVWCQDQLFSLPLLWLEVLWLHQGSLLQVVFSASDSPRLPQAVARVFLEGGKTVHSRLDLVLLSTRGTPLRRCVLLAVRPCSRRRAVRRRAARRSFFF